MQTLKVDSHRIYMCNPNHIWRCQNCASTSKEAVAKRSVSVKQTWKDRPELKENAAKRLEHTRQDPEFRLKHLAAVQSDEFREMKRQHANAQFSDPVQREAARQKSLKQWEDPVFRAIQGEINAQRWAEGSESRAKASASHLKLWEDAEYRIRMEEVIRQSVSSPAVRGKISATIGKLMQDPMRRAKLLSDYWSCPEVRQEASERMKECYASPEARARLTNGLLNAYAERELSAENYVVIQNALDRFSFQGGFIDKLSKFGTAQAVKYIRKRSRCIDLWQQLVSDVTVVQGSCSRLDLAELTGYAYSTIVTFCAELGVVGLASNNRGLQTDVGRFIRSIYAGDILEEIRPSFLYNAAGNKMELDFYLPNMNLAIEVNGTYWHSSAQKDKNYHYNKSKLCRENGVRLIHIWEHEWNNERQRLILEAMILSALGQSNRVFARKLSIEVRESKAMREFFEINNIQGFRGGEKAVCLVDPKTGEVLMSYLLGKGNHMSKGYQYEIIRGASKLGYTVVGGSSKLLSFIMQLPDVNQIVYYIDYNYFDGRSLQIDDNWKFKSEQVSFKNYWTTTAEVKNREPKKHAEITEKYKTGEVLQLWNAGVATYEYVKQG